ncbi:LOB domain-containing protein 30 [Daucus carota subsp. sativus]|uniref:LOB domain-containing protein 30 n=1 Tax=Daucus carota subsp. sativus TaxID=79200 RepID=UPI0007B2884E|nr:PREDICTED: LOB domain-containing protein 30-like [Daucus carota subsp. sativus]
MNTANPSCATSSGSAPGGGGSSSGSGGSSGGGGPCGACKFLRRKCVAGCIFAPYFDSEQGAAHFAAVHKVFGASNVSKLLLHIPVHKRLDAVVTICYEAQARLRDPVYGCVAHIFALQQQVTNLQAELTYLQAHLATLEVPTPPPAPPPQQLLGGLPLSISDLPAASCMPATYDLSSLFDPMMHQSWTFQQRPVLDPRQFGSSGNIRAPVDMLPVVSGGADFQDLARELFQRHDSPQHPCSDPSTMPPHSR